MSLRQISNRATLLANRKIGEDVVVDEILNNPEGEKAKSWLKAREIKESKVKRNYVEACLLASNDIEKIGELLEIPPEVIQTYSEIYFDVLNIDRLTKLELIDVKDKDEGMMKVWALSQGLDFIAWRLGKSVNISPVDGLTDLFNTCIYKSKEAIFNKNTSGASIESTKWVKLSVEIARLLKVWTLDSAGARRDIEIALRDVIPEFKTIDDLDGFSLNVSVVSVNGETENE